MQACRGRVQVCRRTGAEVCRHAFEQVCRLEGVRVQAYMCAGTQTPILVSTLHLTPIPPPLTKARRYTTTSKQRESSFEQFGFNSAPI